MIQICRILSVTTFAFMQFTTSIILADQKAVAVSGLACLQTSNTRGAGQNFGLYATKSGGGLLDKSKSDESGKLIFRSEQAGESVKVVWVLFEDAGETYTCEPRKVTLHDRKGTAGDSILYPTNSSGGGDSDIKSANAHAQAIAVRIYLGLELDKRHSFNTAIRRLALKSPLSENQLKTRVAVLAKGWPQELRDPTILKALGLD